MRFGLLAVVILLGPVGTALLFPATTALLSRQTSRDAMGQTMGVQQSFGSVARLVGPVCGGAIFELNPRYPFWAAAAVMLCTSFLTTRQRSPLQTPTPWPGSAAPPSAPPPTAGGAG